VAGVAACRFIEDGLDHDLAGVLDTGGHPLPLRHRALDLVLAVQLGGRDDVQGCARHRARVVDGGDLGHPLAAPLLPAGQARGRLLPAHRVLLGGVAAGGLAQVAGEHHDALRVEGEHQQRVRFRGFGPVVTVEVVHIRRGASDQLLDLPPARHTAARAGDRGPRVIERPAYRLQGRAFTQAMGVLLPRQGQRHVRRM
jgi:hypothetical protein